MKALEVGLPPVLAKAASDNWLYLLETKSGQQFLFPHISIIDEEWIHLNPFDDDEMRTAEECEPFVAGPLDVKRAHCVRDRGIDLRIDAIAWAADGNS